MNITFLAALFNTFQPTQVDDLIKLLPESEQKSFAQQTKAFPNDFKATIPSFETQFANVHYSWLFETIEKFPLPIRGPIVSSLPQQQRDSLMKLKRFSTLQFLTALSPSLRAFLQQLVYNAWPEKEITPRTQLATSSLDGVLLCSKAELIELFDLIAMHDLSHEVRHIVDQKLLRSILSTLSKNQQRFLKSCFYAKSKPLFGHFNIHEAATNPKGFLNALHSRGIQRVAAALSGCERDFLWHVAHTLDIGRGKILMREWSEKEIPILTSVATTQVTQILQLFKTKEGA